MHFPLVTKCDSGFVEISLRRSPRIKQLSLSRTSSGPSYSVSPPKSQSAQRGHSLQQNKPGNDTLSNLSSALHANSIGSISGKRSLKSDLSFLHMGVTDYTHTFEVQGGDQLNDQGPKCQDHPFGFLQQVMHTIQILHGSERKVPAPQVEGYICAAFTVYH